MEQGGGPARRWRQFGLRSILLLTLFMAVLFAATRAYLNPYFSQSRALQRLRNHVVSLRTTRTLPTPLCWLEHFETRGEDFFREVVHLNMTAGDFSDEHLRHLLAMRCLQTLTIRGEDFDRGDLERIVRLPELRLVVLDATDVNRQEAEACAAEAGVKIRLSQRAVFQFGSNRLRSPSVELGASRGMENGLAAGWTRRGFALDKQGSRCVATMRTADLDFWRAETAAGHDLEMEHWLDVEFMSLVSPDDEFFSELSKAHTTTQLNLARSGLTTTGLRQLGDMPRLQRLSLSFPKVKPSLAMLARCQGLTHLFLADAGVTDESLVHLQALDRLQVLHLNANAIRGDGFVHLRQLPLEELSLNRTHISQAGLQVLSSLTTLRRLELAETTLDAHGVAILKPLVRLKHLVLRRTHVDERALPHLGVFENLQSLSLQNTAIDGSQLMCLASLTNLRHLDVSLTRVTEEQVKRLRERLPEVTVSR